MNFQKLIKVSCYSNILENIDYLKLRFCHDSYTPLSYTDVSTSANSSIKRNLLSTSQETAISYAFTIPSLPKMVAIDLVHVLLVFS